MMPLWRRLPLAPFRNGPEIGHWRGRAGGSSWVRTFWVAAGWADRLIYLKLYPKRGPSLRSEGSDTSRQSGGEACTGIFSFRQMGRS
jgi:hypothetical protein